MIVAIGIAIFLNYFVFKPIYAADTQLLLNQKTNGQAPYSWDSIETDIQLINTYNVIIKSPAIIDKVIEELKLTISEGELVDKISIYNEAESKVINISIEDESYPQAVEIANKLAEVFMEEIPSLMSIDNINILSKAKMIENPAPVKPSKLLNISIAAVLGFMLGLGLTILLELLNTKVKTESEIEELLNYPILGVVSSFKAEKYAKKSRKRRRNEAG